MAKLIKIENEYEPMDAILGITTSLYDYRLAFFVSKVLNSQLKNTADLPVSSTTGIAYYPFFISYSPAVRTHFFLVGNYNGQSFLLPKFKQIDYFLFLRGPFPDHDPLQKQLKSIENVVAVFKIDESSIKNLTSIINSIDWHVLEQSNPPEA